MQTDPEAITEQTAPAPNLHVLNYVTKIDSPTRGCFVAAKATQVLAVLCLLVAIPATGLFIYGVYETAESVVRFGPPRPWFSPSVLWVSFWARLQRSTNQYGPIFLLLPIVQWVACLLPVCGRIARGRRISSILAGIAWGTVIPLVVLATAIACLISLYVAFFAIEPYLVALLGGLVAFPVGALLTLICKDVCALLFWIARHKGVEKPKQPFLPIGAPQASTVQQS